MRGLSGVPCAVDSARNKMINYLWMAEPSRDDNNKSEVKE